jgi:DNA repair exonuclease SbcCD ATPase subunit
MDIGAAVLREEIEELESELEQIGEGLYCTNWSVKHRLSDIETLRSETADTEEEKAADIARLEAEAANFREIARKDREAISCLEEEIEDKKAQLASLVAGNPTKSAAKR